MFGMETKNVTCWLKLFLFSFFFVCLLAFPLYADTITTITVKEMDGISTTNYPLTFGHVFKEGDVTGNVYLSSYPTQTDVKTTYDDGSIRVAVISALVPMTANSDTVLNINTTGTAASTTPMTQTEILATDIGATIDLTGLSGSGYSGDLQADLRAAITAASSLDYWLEGDVVSEILIDQSLNNSLDATWEVRFYEGTSYIRVSHCIENVNITYRGNINYAVEIKQGNATPTSVYTKTSFQHNHSSRWRKVFWLGTEPPEVEIHYNLDYLVSTGMVMPYDSSVVIPEATISSQASDWSSADTDIMDNGFIMKLFGTTGGRPEIGILPKWAALYLLSMDNRMRKILLGNGEMSGSIPIHFREDDSAMAFNGKVVSIDDRPTMDITAPAGIPVAIGTTTTDWSPDKGHQGSFAYLPYLITGEKFFLDEVYYWGAYDLGFDEYRRAGDGTDQDFSGSIGDGTASNGILYGMMRGTAWALRNVNDAAIVAPDSDTELTAYFTEKAANNLLWLKLGNTVTSHGLHAVRVPREQHNFSYHNPWEIVLAPWQHDFVVLVLADINRKGNQGSTPSDILSVIGQFTVGRFANDPTFNKWDGAGYWWPLKGLDPIGYFDTDDWAEYWDTVLSHDQQVMNQGLPHSDYSRYNYSYSYLLIAKAALSQLTFLPGGIDAYNFVNGEYNANILSDDPTWGLVPKIIESPRNLSIQ